MAKKIKLFFIAQQMYAIQGICPSAQLNEPLSMNYKILRVLLAMAMIVTASLTFFTFDAKSVMDFGMAVSDSNLELLGVFNFIVNMIQMPNIVKLIENCEKFIEKSKRCYASVLVLYLMFRIFTHIFNKFQFHKQEHVIRLKENCTRY